MIAVTLLLAAIGPWLIELLYDVRYHAAGPMVTLFALSLVPLITLTTTGPMLLAMGDSRRVLVAQLLTAVLQTCLLFVGIAGYGVLGAILAPGLATLAAYPLRAAYARRYNAWDPVQDLGMTAVGLLGSAAICLWHLERFAGLLP